MSLAKPWDRGLLCLELLRRDPSLGGIVIKCRAGPVRDRFLRHLPTVTRRIHPQMDDYALFGGMDVTATLSSGQIVTTEGLVTSGDPLLLTMAERMTEDRAARLMANATSVSTMILLDESADGEETLPPIFEEQLAFHINLNDTPLGQAQSQPSDLATEDEITLEQAIKSLAQISLAFGISSLRAPTYALKTARALAALESRRTLTTADVTTAATLVFAHRAARIPETPSEQDSIPPETEGPQSDRSHTDQLEDQLVEAIKTALPQDILNILGGTTKTGRGRGRGNLRKSNRRGRPLPSRPGRPERGKRLDLIATLRAAAPYQGLRKAGLQKTMVKIRPSDLHIRQYEEQSDRLITFAVDASGSAAAGRLAEAKGAVEFLLADAYARRDHVALIAFRGDSGELLLPPTRSLVQTKRRLASLPGGGGTPLASGIEQSLKQAILARSRGMTPTICILTDGRANIDRSGNGNRKQAAQDAVEMAKCVRAEGLDAIVIDTGTRPEKQLRTLASVMDATYISLPRADAPRISGAVNAALAE